MTATLRKRRLSPDGPIVQMMMCGRCAVGHHSSCVARIRNGFDENHVRRFIDCPCCGAKTLPKCLDCGNRNQQEVHGQLWECLDLDVCKGRQQLRRNNDPVYQMLQAIKSDNAIRRRQIRLDTLRRLAQVPLDEEELLLELERPRRNRGPRVVRPTSGSCICCGAVTKGGSFLPGHDAKYKSALRKLAKGGNAGAQQTLVDRGWA